MNWEDCQDFGYVEVDYASNGIRVYASRIESRFISAPGYGVVVESALWSGKNIIVRCRDKYGNPQNFMQRSFYEFIPLNS